MTENETDWPVSRRLKNVYQTNPYLVSDILKVFKSAEYKSRHKRSGLLKILCRGGGSLIRLITDLADNSRKHVCGDIQCHPRVRA